MVLHVLKSYIYSGAENVVCQIIENTNEDALYLSPRGPIEEVLRERGIKYRGIDKLDKATLLEVIEEVKPDLVHAHDFSASVICGLACKGKYPVISHIHCNPPWLKSRFNPKSLSYLYASRYFAAILTVSDAVMDEYVYANRIKCQVKVLGNPFSVESVFNKADFNEKKYSLSNDKIIESDEAIRDTIEESVNLSNQDLGFSSDILYVGRLSEEKNPLRALEVIEELCKIRPDLRANIVGDGALMDACKSFVSENGLEKNVSLLGFQKNPYNYMAKTKVVIVPSNWEGFGLVALESMTFSKPVLASGAGGLSNLVDDSCGAICTNVKEYVAEAKKLFEDEKYYLKKANGALEKAKKFDNIKSYAKSIDEVYKEVER